VLTHGNAACSERRNIPQENDMPSPIELEHKFWKALQSDRTVMLGLVGEHESHTRPMTAQLEGTSGPIWFFTTKESELVRQLETGKRAVCTFASKGNDLFAAVHGTLITNTHRDAVERLWNPFVAAWYDGKDDPKLALLRFDPDAGEIWLNDSSLFAGVKMLLGIDPKESYKDKVAKVDLS
jgi:general stress protein 26